MPLPPRLVTLTKAFLLGGEISKCPKCLGGEFKEGVTSVGLGGCHLLDQGSKRMLTPPRAGRRKGRRASLRVGSPRGHYGACALAVSPKLLKLLPESQAGG